MIIVSATASKLYDCCDKGAWDFLIQVTVNAHYFPSLYFTLESRIKPAIAESAEAKRIAILLTINGSFVVKARLAIKSAMVKPMAQSQVVP